MTELMQLLYDYMSEKRVLTFLPKPQAYHWGAALEGQEEALLDTLDASQKALWPQWRNTQMEYEQFYEKALFQAAFALAKELR